MKPSLPRRWTSYAVCFLMITSLITPAMAQEIARGIEGSFQAEPEAKVSLNDFKIFFKQEDLNLRYGDYAEVEFSADVNEEVEFKIDEKMFPVGLQLEPIGSNTVLLLGAPEFVDKFCFALTAKSKNSDKEASQRVCLFGEENEELEHPTFISHRDLKAMEAGVYESLEIELDSRHSGIEPLFVLGELPEGLEVDNGRGELSISGETEYTGVFELVALAQSEDFHVYKQFLLEVRSGADTGYQCDIGYYYDETVGYCVQNQGDICEDGTFYDPDSNQCVRYTTPSHISCSPGYYYDHFLYRCVKNDYNRCPYNYEWDPYYNRCERLPNTCSIGYRYSYSSRSCVYVGAYQCGVNEHYSSYYDRCVSNYNSCRAGQYWDGYSCRNTARVCIGFNRYFDPVLSICRSRNYYHSCAPGSRFSYSVGRCVRRSVYSSRTCGIGSRYSASSRRCISYRATPNRPVRVRRPVVRRPVVVRPTRPVHRPHRPNRPTRPVYRPTPHRPTPPTTRPHRPTPPTTRPHRPTPPTTRPHRPTPPTTRPNRPTPPSRPTTRPSRPTTRPTPPPRPSRPTTRPSRPTTRPTPPPRPSRPTTRPSRPTTRPTPPSRPSRPTTRPSRPSRPTTRPAPSRPSRPTTRPSRSSGSGRSSGSRPSRPRRS